MVRIKDIPDLDARHLLEKECPEYETEPFIEGPPLKERRVAVITTAGLHRRSDKNFFLQDTGYRVLPGDIDLDDVVMSHTSVNYDRIGFQQDVNVVFPLDRLRELEAAGEIGSLGRYHYSLMGAGWLPHEIEPTCKELAGHLKEDGVNAVLLVPV
ncbi:MAG TPA: selenoprotein B glycine/betaine/sarcosine/D-proline reductase [Rhodospirillaceae bacterium]|nr:selenoprotein B glycine/betaine/sarcosine/D-proline reductase [Rhodospirillaceae bacterium]HAA93540.1 selenoprotein B glycine/betaine/sarcosine/D-proline reductase [Rhodospirillaceae bacterium]HAT35007.1 selenoprotein B glycine/betaine/sarcosine/D-proline reductase [Rhodospirillaceae bacterium]